MDGSGERRIALLLEYDGTDFSGSQLQPGMRTIQGVVEAALESFTGERGRVAFAGRTDAGVHASGQVATLSTHSAHSPATFRDALNHFLPEDVVVRMAAEVAGDFDPRRHASARVYRYRIEDGLGPVSRRPLRRRMVWQVVHPLDVPAMAAALALLPLGTEQDWAAFAGAVPDGYPTVRTLLYAGVERCGPHDVRVMLEAGGFLPHQVRMTVGALARVGGGGLTPQGFAGLVDGAPGTAGPAAPPQGLTLVTVRYPPGTMEFPGDELETGTSAR
ncbi:MAG: tRNA pseudouridine synthase A [Chloroflexi bacterium]|nr:tRNA pseudouridine synthase A [Chloroflexota bacterium]MQC19178.1 tRNA pseudouridine synthase A [Chloroflexota bacterium]